MNIFQRIFGTKNESNKKTYDINDIMSLVFPSTGSNTISSNADALEKSVWIERAISSIAETASSMPWHIYKRDKIDQRAEEKLIYSNSNFTFTEIQEKTMSWQCIEGYAPWYVELGTVNPIDADMLEVKMNPNGSVSYRFRGTTNRPLIAENIVLFPNFTPYAKLTGLSELKTCIDMANLGENAIQLVNNIMLSGGLLTGILTTDQNLNPDEVRAVKDRFKELYGGIYKAGEVAIFGRGLTWTKLGISPGEFSVIDLTKVTRNGVSVAFGVPEIYLAGTESVDYANSRTQESIFIKTTIKPKCDRFADRVTRFVLPKLLNSKEYIFKFDWTSVEALQLDKLAQAQIDEIDIRSGKRLINELRQRDGLDDVPWGNTFWGSAMLMAIGTAGRKTNETESLSETIGKLFSLYNEKKVIQKVITQETKEKIWNRFVKKTEPQEKRLIKEINKYFDDQKKSILEKITSEKSLEKSEESVVKFSIDDLLPSSWNDKLKKLLKPFILAFMQQAGDDVVNEYSVGISFNLQDPKIQAWLDWKLENSALEINNTTRDAIQEAVREGGSISDIADSIRNLFEQTYVHRAETIARTEVISANNKASLEGMKQCGIKTKTWLAALDERTREAHAAADGQTVGIDEPFNVGGEKLDFPGDPKGSPGNIINCRCSIIWEGE